MLNKRLKSTRLSRGLTQVEAAKALGVTQAFLSKLELGGAAPNVAMLKRIAKLYDVTETYLVGDSPPVVPRASGGSAVDRLLQDDTVQPGLSGLAKQDAVTSMLEISDEEWEMLRSIRLDCTPRESGYMLILMAIRGACRESA